MQFLKRGRSEDAEGGQIPGSLLHTPTPAAAQESSTALKRIPKQQCSPPAAGLEVKGKVKVGSQSCMLRSATLD